MRLTRHLPLLLLLVAIWSMASCNHDEPLGNRPGHGGNARTDTTNTRDTTGNVNPPDTTGRTNPTDTTNRDTTGNDTFTLTLSAERDYGYMGQSLQVYATTSDSAAVIWKSTNTLAATVNNEGLVLMANVRDDCETHIIATANNVSDTLLLHNRVWRVAMLENNTWATDGTRKVHPGDTIVITIVDSASHLVNDDGFNAGACQWTVTCREAEVAQIISAADAPALGNNWQARYVIAPGSPVNVTFSIQARYQDAAAALSCTILP